MNKIYKITSELARCEGMLMGYHEGLDQVGKEANLVNLSQGLLEMSKKLNQIQKDLTSISEKGEL